jgi:hypothetical protein
MLVMACMNGKVYAGGHADRDSATPMSEGD